MKTATSNRRAAILSATAMLALLGACGALPDKPRRATLYDFGPGPDPRPGPAAPAAQRPAITLADVEATARLDGTQMFYRLAYADAQALHAYSQARWSQPPGQLLRLRLREALARERTVLATHEAAGIARSEGRVPDLLRVSLDEFSHHFESPTQSVGLLRLRATLLRNAPAGDRVLAQRSFSVRSPAPTPDAAGGARALAAASDAVAAELVQWVDAQPR